MAVEPVRHVALLGLLMRAQAAVVALAASTLLVSPALAQPGAAAGPAAAPATRDMIEALKPGRQRNLVVRQTTPDAPGPVAPPALPPQASVNPAPAPTPAKPPPATGPMAPPPVTTATPGPPPAPATPPPLAPTPAPTIGEPPPSLSLAIQFELNSARVRPESGEVLGNLVAAMMSPDLKNNRFVIEGHTDARGNFAANRTLSQQRADEVRLFLVALGVHPARLKAVGRGSSEPADPRNPLSADNRRVRVVTLE